MKYSKPLNETSRRIAAALPDDGLHHESRAIAAHVGRLASQLESLEKLAEHRDPTVTEAAHAKKVFNAAQAVEKKVEQVQNSIHALSVDGSRRLDDLINERANLRPDDFAGEIRTAVRSMSPEKRRDTLAAAVEAGDAATVAALVNAPSVVTGLDQQYTQRMRQAYVEKHAGNEWDATSRLQETISSAIKATGVAKQAVKEASNPSFIREIQEQAEKAAKAQQRFTESLED